MIGAFALQLVLVHAQALGILPVDPRHYLSFLRSLDRNTERIDESRAILRRTCQTPPSNPGQPNITIVVVQLPRLNQDSLNYVALQHPECRKLRGEYWGTYSNSLDRTWELIKSRHIPHVVALDPALQKIPQDPANEITVPLLYKLRSDPSFREERLAESPRILLFHASP
jgi:hypothetical protein